MLYEVITLESRLGSDCFFDLINIDFNNQDCVYETKLALLGKYIDVEELKNFNYQISLKQAGWFKGRKSQQNIETTNLKPELKNAWDIILEFGGLELIRTSSPDYWTPRNIVFPETIERIKNGAEYGINKELVCFAYIDDYNAVLYVDDEKNYYQLDDIVSLELSQFKGETFSNMIQNLLGFDEETKFEQFYARS